MIWQALADAANGSFAAPGRGGQRSQIRFEKLHRLGGYPEFCIEFIACCQACPDHPLAFISGSGQDRL